MCNRRHKDSTPIPKNGYGWKLFSDQSSCGHPPNPKKRKKKIFTLVRWCGYCLKGRSLYVKWDENKYSSWYNDAGFCFLLTKQEAEKAKKQWGDRNAKIVKIKYKNGICQHVETEFTGQNIRMALCKEFRLDPSVKEYRL